MKDESYRYAVGMKVVVKCNKPECEKCSKDDPDHKGFTGEELEQYRLKGSDSMMSVQIMDRKDTKQKLPAAFYVGFHGGIKDEDKGNYMFGLFAFLASVITNEKDLQIQDWQKTIAEAACEFIQKYCPDDFKIQKDSIGKFKV